MVLTTLHPGYWYFLSFVNFNGTSQVFCCFVILKNPYSVSFRSVVNVVLLRGRGEGVGGIIIIDTVFGLVYFQLS